jgi:hypothetical protein
MLLMVSSTTMTTTIVMMMMKKKQKRRISREIGSREYSSDDVFAVSLSAG